MNLPYLETVAENLATELWSDLSEWDAIDLTKGDKDKFASAAKCVAYETLTKGYEVLRVLQQKGRLSVEAVKKETGISEEDVYRGLFAWDLIHRSRVEYDPGLGAFVPGPFSITLGEYYEITEKGKEIIEKEGSNSKVN